MPKGSQRPTAEQRAFAQRLRSDQTDCERLLWRQLRNRQLGGLKFRRQYPVPPYVLDFYCAELRLAIELDGGQHYADAAMQRDERRSRFLQEQGIGVLRFGNHEVLMQMTEVLAEIVRRAEIAAPHPSPLPGGARGPIG